MKLKLIVSLSFALLLVQSSIDISAATQPVSVKAPVGEIIGARDTDVAVFKGIPYAQPPVGERRWKPPLPVGDFDVPFAAVKFGSACVQPKPVAASVYASAPKPMSEDCLSLNIWVPNNAQKAPVFVWIHGGALRAGASDEAMYDGTALAKRGVVVVSINYRLGVLGYLAHRELSAESKAGISGNYGLLDQIEALRWIQNNISAFGGDASNVTIAGESAGALSSLYLMGSPIAHGLYHKVIMQSAYMITSPELREPHYGMPAAEAVGDYVTEKLGAQSLAGLRAMEATDLTEQALKAGYVPWGTVDGVVLPKQLVDIFDQGEQAAVPVMIGFNSGEIRSLRFLAGETPANPATYKSLIEERYGDLTDAFLKQYPATNLEESVLAATRDALYGWTSERVAIKQAKIEQPTYVYYFDHGYPAATKRGLHAFHASEIPFVFENLTQTGPNWPNIPLNKTSKKLSAAMASYWTSFARTGMPRAKGAPEWAPYHPKKSYMRFDEVPIAEEVLLPGMYALHEESMCRRKVAGTQPWNWGTGITSPVLPPKMEACND